MAKTLAPIPAKTLSNSDAVAQFFTAEPVVVAPTPRAGSTTITAQIDVGFGNALYIRGEGAGLSWDRGVLMNCVADNQWQVVLPGSARPVVFKFCVNDLAWSAGENATVEPGAAVTLAPAF